MSILMIILASHNHKNKIIEAQQLLCRMLQLVGKRCFLERTHIRRNSRSGWDFTRCGNILSNLNIYRLLTSNLCLLASTLVLFNAIIPFYVILSFFSFHNFSNLYLQGFSSDTTAVYINPLSGHSDYLNRTVGQRP